MNESKYTPGPWEAGPIDIQTGSVGVFGKRYEGYEIAIVWGDPDSNVTADAALIAAAPETKAQRDELLEAAEGMVRKIQESLAILNSIIRRNEKDGEWDNHTRDAREKLFIALGQACPAIARAKGEQS